MLCCWKTHSIAVTEVRGKPGETVGSVVRSIVLAAVIGFGVVSFWRGVWYLWDVFVFTDPEDKLFSALASLLTGLAILCISRKFYSVLAPPITRVNTRPGRSEEE